MKIATVASDTVWKDAKRNVIAHEKHVEAVLKSWPQTEIILFPEISLMGFIVDESNVSVAETLHGSSVAAMQRIAKENRVAICFGLIELNPDGKPYNSQVVIDSSGFIVATYHKNHLFTQSSEPQVYTAGNNLTTFELNGWTCGLSTCFDIRFPRLFEAYKKSNVELMLSGFNWVEGRNKPNIMESLVKARAHENQFFFAAVDRSGRDLNSGFYGNSIIANPYAEDIALRKGVYSYAELDKSEIAALADVLPLEESYKEKYKLNNVS